MNIPAGVARVSDNTDNNPLKLDLVSQAFKANPYPTYAHLRSAAPVALLRLPDGRHAWLISRYSDVMAALRDPRLSKDRRKVTTRHRMRFERFVEPMFRSLQFNMLDLDPPDHTRLRALVHKAFTPRLVEQLRERIESLANHLLDRAAERRELELVADYALPIPATVIADLLGVPVSDRHRFHRWTNQLVGVSSGGDVLKALPSLLLFKRYLERLIKHRRLEPRDDLISALVQAEEAGDRLNGDELTSMLLLLLVAGHETTVNLIANGLLALLEQPDQLQRLRAQPALLDSGTAVEELLRYCSPVQIATERYAVEDVQFPDQMIPAGALVLCVIGSANHDQSQFASPEHLDLARSPNPHLAFGQGMHYCLGAPLARLEAHIAFETLLARCADIELGVPPESLTWRRGIFLRGVERLPLRLSNTTRAPVTVSARV
jgi:cytochrome P450 PksS